MTDPTALPNFGTNPANAAGGGAAPNGAGAAGGADEAPLKDRLVAALSEMGLEPSIDGDGDVAFTFEQQQLFIRAADEDAQIIRVFGQWQLQEPVPSDPLERLQSCNDLNVSFNLVKAAVANDTLLVTSEHIIPRGADVRGLLGLAVPLVLHGVQLWHQRATGQYPQVDEQGNPVGPEEGSGASATDTSPTDTSAADTSVTDGDGGPADSGADGRGPA